MPAPSHDPALTLADIACWNEHLAPDLCYPSQFYREPLAERLEPYRRLAVAMVLVSFSRLQNESHAERRASNETWFTTTRGPTSFACVAELLEVDPTRLRDAIRGYTGRRPHHGQVRRGKQQLQARKQKIRKAA